MTTFPLYCHRYIIYFLFLLIHINFFFVGCYDNCIYVLCVHTGRIVWKFATGGAVKSSPCVDYRTELVIVGSHDQHVYALDLKVFYFLPKYTQIFSFKTLSTKKPFSE